MTLKFSVLMWYVYFYKFLDNFVYFHKYSKAFVYKMYLLELINELF